MSAIGQTEWLNQNSLRNYPFREDMSLIPDGQLNERLPNYLITDFVLTIPATFGTRVYLSKLTIISDYVMFEFSDQNGTQITNLTVKRSEHDRNDYYALYGIANVVKYQDVRGKIVLGDLTNLLKDITEGEYAFSITTAEMEPCTIRPVLQGLRGIIVESGDTQSKPLQGYVQLKAGANAQLAYDEDTKVITFSAVSLPDRAYNEKCEGLEVTPIRYINGINAEHVNFIGDGCMEVDVSGNTIKISNTCAEPCCGGTELEFIENTLALLTANIERVERYFEDVVANFTELKMSAIAAGLYIEEEEEEE